MGDIGGFSECLQVTCMMAVTIFASAQIKSKFVSIFNRVIVIKDNQLKDRSEVNTLIKDINTFGFLFK